MDKKETKKELFRKLFTTFYDRLYGFALSRVLCRDAAADITNEVFCRLWEQFDRLDFSTSPLPLLYTMTRNRCSDHLRQKTARPAGSDTDAENVLSEDTLAEVMERERRIVSMMNALEKLPPQTRRVVELCFLKNMKYREAAAELGISVNTVKTLLSRAMKFLRSGKTNDN